MDRILIILNKRKWPKGFICPSCVVKYHNIQSCLLVHVSNYIIIEYCNSNHLIPISVLYDFWFLRNTRFRRYTPSIFCAFSLIFKVSSIFERHESLIINVYYFVVL